MNENSSPAPAHSAPAGTADEQAARQTRADHAASRIAAIGIPKQELAQRAGIDRGTLGRALKADPRIVDRTWVKIERELSLLEEELGISFGGGRQLAVEDETVTSTVEYADAKITLSGRADQVAEAIRRVLSGDA